jgi:DNA mismatch endonuclease, patch repair protein
MATRKNSSETGLVKMQTDPGRSALMRRVRQRGTAAECEVRRLLHATGARFRSNASSLPGRPDIANVSRHRVIFVHGCFWHDHEGCSRATKPKRNAEFWRKKFRDNRQRDRRKVQELKAAGFEVLTVWECELDDPVRLKKRLRQFWFGAI